MDKTKKITLEELESFIEQAKGMADLFKSSSNAASRLYGEKLSDSLLTFSMYADTFPVSEKEPAPITLFREFFGDDAFLVNVLATHVSVLVSEYEPPF